MYTCTSLSHMLTTNIAQIFRVNDKRSHRAFKNSPVKQTGPVWKARLCRTKQKESMMPNKTGASNNVGPQSMTADEHMQLHMAEKGKGQAHEGSKLILAKAERARDTNRDQIERLQMGAESCLRGSDPLWALSWWIRPVLFFPFAPFPPSSF